MPRLDSALDYIQWFNDVSIVDAMDKAARRAFVDNDFKLADDIKRSISSFTIAANHIVKNPHIWVSEYALKGDKNQTATVTLKPVMINDFANDLLFGRARHTLMMSATILDVDIICRSLGLNRSDVAAYRMQNRFPVQNRKIYVQPVARIAGGAKKMDLWADKLVKKVESIVRKYPGKRGIIHTANFAIMDLLINECGKDVSSRFLNQRNYLDKTEMLDFHSTTQDSIIIAPAMHEGVDLKDDLSRFQIICKVPYPNFFDDEQLSQRKEIDSDYIPWLTALRLVQSSGRSIRSVDDWADTYIIDGCFRDFLDSAGKFIPKWFKDALVYEGK